MSQLRTALFDADVLAYRFGHNGVVDLDFGDGDDAALVDPDEAVRAAKEHVAEVTEACGCDDVILCWSDPGEWENFRLEIDPTYKWKRPGHTGRPANYNAVREGLSDAILSKTLPRLEADDVMGIIQTAPASSGIRKSLLRGGETIIISVDKDMLQVPGLHYNPVTKRRSVVEKVDGDHLHMVQTLMGDAVDNYDGVPGIGIKKAEAILKPAGLDPELEWTLVLDTYVEHLGLFPGWWGETGMSLEGFAANEALKTARLAKILQWENYDTEWKSWLPWMPGS